MRETVRNVLVLCGHNSARSQMAEGFLRKHGGDRFQVHSAGMEATKIHPLTVCVMEEIGVPLEGQRSKRVREYLGKLAVHDLIVVCARTERECPKLFPGALNHHFWPFPDPAAVDGPLDEKLAAFREVRDQIERRVLEWLNEPENRPVRGQR